MEPQPNRRHQRLNDLLRDQLSDLLLLHTRDPRLATMVSITGVELSPDMRYAKVFASIMGDEDEQRAALRALRGAERYLRRELGERVKLRHIPELQFQQDTAIERSARISHILKEVAPTDPDTKPDES